MRWSDKLRLRIRSLLRRSDVEAELDEELRYHFERQIEENSRRGMTPEEARHAARFEFGGVEQHKEECRDARHVRLIEETLRDVRHGGRFLWRSPGFTAAAMLTLALGIGGTTAVFSLLDQVVLRRLPVKAPEELVLLSHDGPYAGSNRGNGTFSNPMYRDLSARNDVLTGITASIHEYVNLAQGGRTERVAAMLVSGNYFEVLGADTILGRPFTAEDDVRPSGHPVLVLSYGYWQRRFGGDRRILNQQLLINGHPMMVVGVAPRGFHGAYVGRTFDVMTPIMMKAEVTPSWNDLHRRRSLWLRLAGRRKPGVSIEQAEASLAVLYRSILAEEAEEMARMTVEQRESFVNHRLSLEPGATGRSNLRQVFRTPLIVLTIMVGLVLLIACANLANLLVARATVRRKEIAMRLALGAGRWRIARQMLVESLMLSLSGGALGLLLAAGLLPVLVGFLPSDIGADALHTNPDARALAFTLAISLLTGVIFGLLPAFGSTGAGLIEAIKGGVSDSVSAPRVRQALVVAQVALSLLLLIGCGLFARSLYNLLGQDTGFPVERLVTFSVNARSSGYSSPEAIALYRRLQDQLRLVPEIRSASMSVVPLLRNQRSGTSLTIPSYHAEADEYPFSYIDYTGPGFFGTMGIAVVAGREFSDRDFETPRAVAMINEAMAKRYFADRNPIGENIHFFADRKPIGENIQNAPEAPPVEIVGVVRDIKYHDLRDEPHPFTFRPLAADPTLGLAVYYVRTRHEVSTLTSRLRQAAQAVEPRLAIYDVRTLEHGIGEMLYVDRLLAWLSSAFGLLATLLAAIGVYGVLAYNVARRTREFGIRVAMGAGRANLSWLVLREVAILTAIGALLAIPASYVLSRFVESRLFGVSPTEPALIAAATLVLVLVGLAAGSIPAFRATRIQPMQALRTD